MKERKKVVMRLKKNFTEFYVGQPIWEMLTGRFLEEKIMSTQGHEVEICYPCTPCNPTNWILIPLCLYSRLFFKLLFDGIFSYIKILKLLFFPFCFNNSELFNCTLLEKLWVMHFKDLSFRLPVKNFSANTLNLDKMYQYISTLQNTTWKLN